MKRKYKRWKSGTGSKEIFIESKKVLKKKETYCGKKERRKEEELKFLKNKKKIWNYINKQRRKRDWTENNIQGEK